MPFKNSAPQKALLLWLSKYSRQNKAWVVIPSPVPCSQKISHACTIFSVLLLLQIITSIWVFVATSLREFSHSRFYEILISDTFIAGTSLTRQTASSIEKVRHDCFNAYKKFLFFPLDLWAACNPHCVLLFGWEMFKKRIIPSNFWKRTFHMSSTQKHDLSPWRVGLAIRPSFYL